MGRRLDELAHLIVMPAWQNRATVFPTTLRCRKGSFSLLELRAPSVAEITSAATSRQGGQIAEEARLPAQESTLECVLVANVVSNLNPAS